MIIAFMSKEGALHGVHTLHQKGLTKIGAKGFCGVEEVVGDGVFQVADWAFDGRSAYGEVPVCINCTQRVMALKVPPK